MGYAPAMVRRLGLAWLLLTGCTQRVVHLAETALGGADEGDDAPGTSSSSGGEASSAAETSGLPPPGPGPVELDTIYVNSGDSLFTFVPQTNTFERVGPFVLEDGSAASVTDIAIDRFGYLYAVSVGALYVCDPETVTCERIGTTSANSAGFVEFGALSPTDDVLILVEGSDVVQVVVREGGADVVRVGTLEGYSSSGDVMPLGGTLMLLSSPAPGGGDVLVAFDASNAEIVGEVAELPPLTYGLAGFAGEVWGFTDRGQIVFVDDSGLAVEVGRTDVRLWGAATHPDSR